MFDDDNFWAKLDRDNNDIEFMNNSPTYNGSKYRRVAASNNKNTKTQTKQERVVPVTCNINDYSLFDKTKIGKVINVLTCIFSISSWIFFLLAIIFGVGGMSVYILFTISFALSTVALIVVCFLRATLNKEYKKQLIAKKKEKNKKEDSNKKSIGKINNKNKKPN